MTRAMRVLQIGPGVAVQDLGRAGFMAQGVTRGGAADVLALHEGAALLQQDPALAALEMVGFGGQFEAQADLQVALTGAEMKASIGDQPIVWNASHGLKKGQVLSIGGTLHGTYGYLHVAGGFETEIYMGARATHLSSGFGALVQAGDLLPVGPAQHDAGARSLPRDARFDGGLVHVVTSMQTHAFSDHTRARFENTAFRRDSRGNRQGVRIEFDGAAFEAEGQLAIVSEVITAGDIQIPGDGRPFILMCESQTTGGYPRIGTVLPADMPRVAQAQTGAPLRFSFLSLEDARMAQRRADAAWAALPRSTRPLLRNVHEMTDLLGYQLIDGVISANDAPLDKG